MDMDLNVIRNWAIVFIFSILFGTAAWDKFKTLKTPEWFIKQFENTIVAKMPGGATLGYWKIAVLEAILTVMFVSAFFVPGMLAYALTGALFFFGILCFGLRVVSEFQGSANMFIYFTASLISLMAVRSFP